MRVALFSVQIFVWYMHEEKNYAFHFLNHSIKHLFSKEKYTHQNLKGLIILIKNDFQHSFFDMYMPGLFRFFSCPLFTSISGVYFYFRCSADYWYIYIVVSVGYFYFCQLWPYVVGRRLQISIRNVVISLEVGYLIEMKHFNVTYNILPI